MGEEQGKPKRIFDEAELRKLGVPEVFFEPAKYYAEKGAFNSDLTEVQKLTEQTIQQCLSIIHFKELLKGFLLEVKEFLPDVEQLSDNNLVLALMIYQRVIQPRFIPWLQMAKDACISGEAHSICLGNLRCEVEEKHPKMLENFMAPLHDRYPLVTAIAIQSAYSLGQTIRELNQHSVFQLSGVVQIAALENSSLVFIPWMKQAADRLGLKEQMYLEKHGIADIDHAQEFVHAVGLELVHAGGTQEEVRSVVEETLDTTKKLLYEIFANSRVQ